MCSSKHVEVISWNEEIGTITQNPHGTADIILDNSCFDTVSV
jgi:hypothetical protein